MSEFKISLGFDIEENSKAKIQDIIDEINAKKPEITIKVKATPINTYNVIDQFLTKYLIFCVFLLFSFFIYNLLFRIRCNFKFINFKC